MKPLVPALKVAIHLRLDDQAPENLVAFLDGRTLSSSEPSEPEPERPKKRRKLTGPNTLETPFHPSDPDDYLTLARVDIVIVRV